MRIKGTIGLLVFIGCIWAVAIFTYGAQVQKGDGNDPSLALQDMQNASCSSSSSSSSGQ
jgi:hypothetical protein